MNVRVARELTLLLVFCFPLALRLLTICTLLVSHGGYQLSEPLSSTKCADGRFLTTATLPNWGFDHGNITVVLQISDLHLNAITGSRAHRTLSDFISIELPAWTPIARALLISGDLVDGKQPPTALTAFFRLYHSRQDEAEWRAFSAAFNNSALPVLPVFGNHDVFGGIGASHCAHAGRAAMLYPCTGTAPSVYRHRVSAALSVVGFDATPSASLHAPLNFFGELREHTISELDTSLREIRAEDPNAVTLLLSHYPASIIAGGGALARLARGESRPRFTAHLSGHLHTLHKAAPYGLQTISQDGYIEAQLPDLKWRRRFRVLVVDHGVLSLHDLDMSSNPHALPRIIVTNPPAAHMCAPGAGAAALRSTHIRFIVAKPPTTSMFVSIDGRQIGRAEPVCQASDTACDSLYKVRWDVHAFDDGQMHTMQVRSADGTELHVHKFSIRGLHPRTLFERMNHASIAVMALTPFDAVLALQTAVALFASAFFLVAAALTPGRRQAQCVPLAIYLLTLVFGPVIISDRLRTERGIGYVGFFSMRLSEARTTASPDPHLWMSGPVLWNTMLPLALLVCMEARGARVLSSVVGKLNAFLLIGNAVLWAVHIWVSYGFVSVMLSPSAVLCCVLMTSTLYDMQAQMSSREAKKKDE